MNSFSQINEKYKWSPLPFHDSYIDNEKLSGNKADGFKVTTLSSYKEINSAEMWGLSEISEYQIDCNKATFHELKTIWTENEMGKGKITKVFKLIQKNPGSIKKVVEGAFQRDLYNYVCNSISVPSTNSNKDALEKSVKTVIENYENAGTCVGASLVAFKAGINTTSYSPKAQFNMIKIQNEINVNLKFQKEAESCYKNGEAIKIINSCIENKIADKKEAAYWKGYVIGREFITSKKENSDKQQFTDGFCALLVN